MEKWWQKLENYLHKPLTRKEFLKQLGRIGVGIGVSPFVLSWIANRALASVQLPKKGFIYKKEAMFYKKLPGNRVQCELCPRYCVLTDGMRGFCRAREPEKGVHYTHTYANPTAVHIDPIEKKPLFHFLPGTMAFSIATAGCNFRCLYCQNWEISQFRPEDTYNYFLLPDDVVKFAKKYGCASIAYTYTEPSIFYEYMYDTSVIAKQKGVLNIYHSNGSLNPEPVKKLARYLDGANIDLKGFNQDFYSKVSQGYLDVVLNTLVLLKQNGVWVEVTNLVVPGYNDDPNMVRKMSKWMVSSLGADTPLHLSRFYPTYKLKNKAPTPVKTLESLRKVAQDAGLKYVYIGNVPGHKAENTYCPSCGKVLIKRVGYRVLENNIVDGKCKFCKTKIEGFWTNATASAKTK